ncbi:MAG: outer membrane lipoprotein-sorting protein [Candidatus Hydrogenedentota bacterium]
MTFSFVTALSALTAVAETAEEEGLAIYKEVDARDIGWKNSSTDLKMLLKNRHGQTSTRELSMQTLETNEPGLGDKSLTVFSSPRDVDGTAFLSHTKIIDPDDQWLYLPALKRVKRISSSNKSGPFMGSEFAFEDLSSQEVEKYTYKYIKDETAEGQDCFVVERYPVYKNSGYTRQITWVDKAEYRPIKIAYYDRKNALLKTLVFSDYNQHRDKFWRAHTMTMENQQTGKSTVLTFENYDFDFDISESTFTPARLKNIR